MAADLKFFTFTNLSDLDQVYGQLLIGSTPGTPMLAKSHDNTSHNTSGSWPFPAGTPGEKYAWIVATRNETSGTKLALLLAYNGDNLVASQVSAVLTGSDGNYQLQAAVQFA